VVNPSRAGGVNVRLGQSEEATTSEFIYDLRATARVDATERVQNGEQVEEIQRSVAGAWFNVQPLKRAIPREGAAESVQHTEKVEEVDSVVEIHVAIDVGDTAARGAIAYVRGANIKVVAVCVDHESAQRSLISSQGCGVHGGAAETQTPNTSQVSTPLQNRLSSQKALVRQSQGGHGPPQSMRSSP